MWKGESQTSGFEMTFEPHPPGDFSGWAPEVFMFGTTSLTDNYEEITLDNELASIQICVDGSSSYNSDFEGFRFTQVDGYYKELSSACIENRFETFNL